jgi:4-amino-4-deoxy-L-arabinose transferase-like glycosyltransferase
VGEAPWKQPLVVVLLFSLALFGAGFWQGDLRNDSALYGWISRWMVLSGNMMDLYWDRGVTHYFNKPPLQLWLMALSMGLFGCSVGALRIVPVLFAVGCTFLTFRIARRCLDPAGAATAAVILATTATFEKNATGVRLDAGITFFLLAGFWSGLRLIDATPGSARTRDWILLGAATGLGILAKGGVMLMAPGIVLVTCLWLRR